MSDEQARELVRELRWIRIILAGIFLLLALDFAMRGYLRWAETHYRLSPRSQELRDSHAVFWAEPGSSQGQSPRQAPSRDR